MRVLGRELGDKELLCLARMLARISLRRDHFGFGSSTFEIDNRSEEDLAFTFTYGFFFAVADAVAVAVAVDAPSEEGAKHEFSGLVLVVAHIFFSSSSRQAKTE